jgi:hypothetical protein
MQCGDGYRKDDCMDRLHKITELLDRQKNDIMKLICRLESSQDDHDQGSLILSGNAKNKSFYYRAAPGAPLIYLSRKSDDERIRELAQQEYDEKLLAAAHQQIQALQRVETLLLGKELEHVYANLAPAKQALIKPLFPDL